MQDEIRFRVTLIVIALIQIAIIAFYFKAAQAGSSIFRRRDEGLPLSLSIGACYLLYTIGVLVYLANPRWMAWSSFPLPAWIRWAGGLLLILGAMALIWSLHSLGTQLTISISTKERHELITFGPYRWVRHPLYTSGMVESLGVALLTANWFVALAAGCFWGLVMYRTPMEERNLVNTFGDDYRQYMRRAGQFLPKRTAKDDQ